MYCPRAQTDFANLVPTKLMRSVYLFCSVALLTLLLSGASHATLVVYTKRQVELMQPIFDQFTQETAIPISAVYFKNGALERMALEKKQPRADVFLTSDMASILEAKRLGLLAPIRSQTVRDAIPSQYRDPQDLWVALTQRARIFYVAKQAKIRPKSYSDLAQPQFQGQICTRTMLHPYNIGLVSALYAHWGEEKTRVWLRGIQRNLAQPPSGNDREQVRLVHSGACDIAIGNSYYYGLMLDNPKQRDWAMSVDLIFPAIDDTVAGTHVNISGIGILDKAPHMEDAKKFVAFLVRKETQETYANLLNEYPINPAAAISARVASWGKLTADTTQITTAQKYRQQAVNLIQQTGF